MTALRKRATTVRVALAAASAALVSPWPAGAVPAGSAYSDPAGHEGGPRDPGPGPRSHGDSTCGYDALIRRSTVGFGVALGVTQIAEIDGINTRLVRAGFSELPSVGPHLSLSVPLSIERFTMLTQLRFVRLGGGTDSSALDLYEGTFSFGYSLTPPELLAVYPFAGIGIGSAELTVGSPTPTGGSFDQALGSARGGLDLSTLALLGTVGIAADWLLARSADHPTRGLFIGLRTGLSAAFVQSDWSLGPAEGNVSDGPAAPMSGWYGEFAFGLRL
jgi:hypothetical protein